MRQGTTLTFWEFRRLQSYIRTDGVFHGCGFPHFTQTWFCLAPVSLIIASRVCVSFTWCNHPWWAYFPKGFSNLRCLIIGAAILGLESSHWGTRGVKARCVCDLDMSWQSSPWGRTLNLSLIKQASRFHFLHSLNILLEILIVSLHLLLGFLSERENVCLCAPHPPQHTLHAFPRQLRCFSSLIAVCWSHLRVGLKGDCDHVALGLLNTLFKATVSLAIWHYSGL